MKAKKKPLALAFACIMLACALSLGASLYSHSLSSASVFFSLFSPDSLTNPPLAVIVSDSMKPTLERGDVAFIHKVDPGTIKVGDVVAVWVPTKYRNEYKYPPRIIHRVTEIKEIRGVTYIETKGDNSDKEDIFRTPLRNVIGVYSGFKIPYIGLIFLFARSTIGMIYFAIVAITLFLLKYVPYRVNREKEREERINELCERTDQFQEGIHDLASAISEYAVHLNTHTSILQNLNSTTGELKRVTEELASNVTSKDKAADELEGSEIREEGEEELPEPAPADTVQVLEVEDEEVEKREEEKGEGEEEEVEGVETGIEVRYKEAFKLFQEGISPLNLVTEYDFSPDEAKLAFFKYKELLSIEADYQNLMHGSVSKKRKKWLRGSSSP
ncbi:MAG: signal peptidase I [Candidatus Methanospirareceae archaeon]